VARNYYLILGVDPDASPEQIRSAYRCKAKELHPDHYEGSSKPFRDVQEAYETLCDPARRKSYDAGLESARRPRVASRRAQSEPLRSRRVPVEPLFPGAAPSGPSRSSPFAESLDRLWDEWNGRSEPLGRVEEVDDLVIPLTRAQARRGGRLRVWIATEARCPGCWGTGRSGFFECWECGGTGAIVERRPVWIAFPAGVSDGTVGRVSLAPLGEPNAYLTLRFHVR
jgi:molecular chaperone DnaJ